MSRAVFPVSSWNHSWLRCAGLAAAASLVLAPVDAARASDASPWDGEARATVRLVAGTPRREGTATIHRAGVEFRLAPGWKTYWRYPGDSGLPPRFDFAGSENVKSVTIRWPAPQRLDDEAGTSIGYSRDFVLPLEVLPQDAARPVALRLRIDYGICEKLCIPAEGKAELRLSGEASRHDDRLAAFEARVPRAARLGDAGPFAIRAARRENDRMLLDVAAPAGAKVALFAEGPGADWALPVPDPVPGAAAGLERFAFALDGLPPGAKPDGATLTITAVAGESAIEVPVPIP